MGIFSGYMICSDLDGTLAREGYVPEKNSKAIKYFQDNDGIFIVATGRSAGYLDGMKDKFVCDKYIIACNGNVLYNVQTREVEKYYLLDTESETVVQKVIKKFEKKLLRVSFVGIDERTTYEAEPPIIVNEAYKAYDNRITKIVFVTKTPEDALKMQQYIGDEWANCYAAKRTWDTGLEIWNIRAGKEQMVKYLREKLGSIHTVICAGDYENDILMLKEGDLSYAPENALEDAKKAADIIGVSCEDGLIDQIVNDLKRKLLR